jgi:hypothetical protein
MGDAKLSNPRVAVVLADGSQWEVQTLNMDMLRWERTASKHKWPEFRTIPVWWMTFLAWSAGQREGMIPQSVSWEVFSAELCVQVAALDDPVTGSEGTTPVDPTDQAVGTD